MRAIFAGTFDPFTVGHRSITERALEIFGNVTVAVAEASVGARVDTATRKEIARLSLSDLKGVTVETFGGLLSDYVTALSEKCVLVRGIRGVKDYEYERELSAVYASLCGVDSVFLMTDPRIMHVSSTVVRELASLGASLDGYVVTTAADVIKKHYGV